MSDKTPELVCISTNLSGEGCAALLSCLLHVGGPLRITREQYAQLPRYYRIEMYSDSDKENESTIYEARLVAKDTLEPHELQQLLDELGVKVER